MKTCSTLYIELLDKVNDKSGKSGTAQLVQKGKIPISKKLVEEAAEVWMASKFESKDHLALEISQFWYYLMVYAINSQIPSPKMLDLLQEIDQKEWSMNDIDKVEKSIIHTTVEMVISEPDPMKEFNQIQLIFKYAIALAKHKNINKNLIYQYL